MKAKFQKIRPASGFSSIFHVLFTIALPLLVYIFVRINLVQLAIILVLLSKWRMLAVRPRHWPAYIRANAVDMIVGISFVIFMSQTISVVWQLIWALSYAVWLLLIKPGNTIYGMSAQALIAQLLGLMALYTKWGGEPLVVLVLGTWIVCYFCARHFFSSFDDPYGRFLGDYWAFFAGALAWLLGHWLIYYGIVAQPVLLLNVLGFGMGTLYYLIQDGRLTKLVSRQIVFIMIAVVVVVLAFSQWSDTVI